MDNKQENTTNDEKEVEKEISDEEENNTGVVPDE